MLGFEYVTVCDRELRSEHSWSDYLAPTVLTVDSMGEEDVIWGGKVSELLSVTPDLLEARFYSGSSDFKFLLSLFDQADTGISGCIWLLTKASDRQVPKLYWTAGTRDRLDKGIAVEITSEQAIHAFGMRPSSEEFEQLKRFITKNFDVLLRYWNFHIDTKMCISNLRMNQ